MLRLRKSKQPTVSAQPVVSTPAPVELVQNLTSKRDPKALAASSVAIALSIGSAFPDSHDASDDQDVVPGRDTAWRTAYGAARMAVEIAKESTDMFPLLKAVAGAMFVLIKNYDVGVLYS